jgi:hypothetical protein
MRRLLAIALPAVLLLLCAPAAAKEVTGAAVCGADVCRAMTGVGEELLQGGPPVAAPAQGEPFVWLELRFAAGRETHSVRNLFMPRSGLLLGDDGRAWMAPIELATLRRHAGRVAAFPASRLPAMVPLAPKPVPAAAPSPHAADSGDGLRAWWPALPAAALALALGTALARRPRRGGATSVTT